MKRVLLALPLAALAATAAIAHPGPHSSEGLDGVLHAMASFDHLGAIASVAVMAALVVYALAVHASRASHRQPAGRRRR